MLTRPQALALRPGDVLLDHRNVNKRGIPIRWKVTGKVRTWKRDPERFEVPLKHGLYVYGTLKVGDLEYVSRSHD